MKKFRLITLLGIRPDIIRMFKLIKLLDEGQAKHGYEHLFFHTGQHFDYELDEVFFRELGVRKPDVNLGIGKTLRERGGETGYPQQMGLLFKRVQEMCVKYKPDAVMYLGDTNSVLSSVVVARENIPVIHVEAGGRSFDWRMPEEKCRIVIDHMSDALYSYLPRYKNILISEGIAPERVTVIGNIIDDALKQFLPLVEKTSIHRELGVEKGNYALVTIHREENTSSPDVLRPKIRDLIRLANELPVILPVMPRVKKNLEVFGLIKELECSKVILTKPLGFLPFLHLEKEARVTISDSGTVQEESLILGVPCHITRLSTERPETMAAGATILSDECLYENAHRAMELPRTWDRTILNPYPTSPSEVVYRDLLAKITSGFFFTNRLYPAIAHRPFVKRAYGKT